MKKSKSLSHGHRFPRCRAELIELEQANSNPAASNDATHPVPIQAAAQTQVADANDTGGAVAGTSESGNIRSKPSK